jgi:hypothetical protein
MCSKSNPLVVFALDLMSTYEGEHTIFGLLGQANLAQDDVLHELFLINPSEEDDPAFLVGQAKTLTLSLTSLFLSRDLHPLENLVGSLLNL